MKITSLGQQVKNPDRVNVSVDGKYSFSLDISQVVSLGVKVGLEITESELDAFKHESDYGKIYFRALDYCLRRPHSVWEVDQYLRKKVIDEATRSRVVERLQTAKFLSDEKFTNWWVENRMQRKGVSSRRLRMELKQKGVSDSLISEAINSSERNDSSELAKMIARKYNKYEHDKLIMYLQRQGFIYGDIVLALDDYSASAELSD